MKETVYGWGSGLQLQKKREITHWDLWTHVRSNKPELLYYYKVAVWKLSYMYYTTGIPSASVCEKERMRNYVVTPLLHAVLGPWWASQCGLTGALCRQEPGNKENLSSALFSLQLLLFLQLSSFLFFFSHSCCSSDLFHQRAEPDCGSFLSQMLGNRDTGVHLCSRCRCHKNK